jgi:hypothetical protein
MSKQLKYNSTPLKSREEKSVLIKGATYSAKVNFPKSFDANKVLKTTDLGNGYHVVQSKSKQS